jgi:hypothetical protein
MSFSDSWSDSEASVRGTHWQCASARESMLTIGRDDTQVKTGAGMRSEGGNAAAPKLLRSRSLAPRKLSAENCFSCAATRGRVIEEEIPNLMFD